MKTLFTLAALQLLLAPVFSTPSSDYWGEWAAFGACSRTCGGGVMVRTRKCITQRTDGGSSCVGPAKTYRMCNIKDCPEGFRDFREEQCAQFDGTEFRGRQQKWLPYYGAENPCELNCIPKGENFFVRQRSAVVDGTQCHPGRKDICVEGVCKRLGCDNKLESNQKEDPCLQCGGNGQSCYLVRNTFSQREVPTGYNRMFTIPAGATTIRIAESVATRNYLAIRNLRGEYYLNGHWVIDFSRATPIAGTMLYYQRGAEGHLVPETIIGRGPTTEPLVVELISQEPNQGIEYEYYLPRGRSREGYYWSHGSWSPCSRDCGSGYQTRHVFCAIDTEVYSDHLCSALPRPASNRTCNTQACPQVRSWKLGEWNQCSVTCGGGSQVRSVDCVSHEASGPRVVEDAQCESYAQRPISQQNCNMQQCAEYRASAWGHCSVTCGLGEQTREVVCVGAGSAPLGDHACRALLKPPHVQSCQMAACPRHVSWHVGDWGLCSKSCGSGLRERQVICSDSHRSLYGVEHCSAHPKPPTVEDCNTQPCYSPQEVPSTQDPRGHDNTIHGFQPYVPEHAPTTVGRPVSPSVHPTNTVIDPLEGGALARHCSQSQYGCCPDGRTSARGPSGQGCPEEQPCSQSQYGCCPDGRTPARGARGQGCPAERSCSQSQYGCCPDGRTSARGPSDQGCPEVQSCSQSQYGCCPDGRTPARGARGQGCPADRSCSTSRYGCCRDGVTAAQGSNREGCAEYTPAQPTARTTAATPTARPTTDCNKSRYGCCYDGVTHAKGPNGEGCSSPPASTARPTTCFLPRSMGPCAEWSARYYYDDAQGRCVHFWFGGCHGNSNKFLSRQECQTSCQPELVTRTSSTAAGRGGGYGYGHGTRYGTGHGRDMSHVFTTGTGPSTRSDVTRSGSSTSGGSTGSTAPRGDSLPLPLQRFGSNAAINAYRARVHMRGRRPAPSAVPTYPLTQAQHTMAATSWTDVGVSIDKSDPSTVEGLVGQRVVLPCRVSPPPSYSPSIVVEWKRDGTALAPARHIQQPNGSLLVGPLTVQDSAWFLCMATRDRERDYRYIYLSVSEPPPGSRDQEVRLDEADRPGAEDSYQPFPRFSIDQSESAVVEARQGQTARLTCRVTPPSAIPTVTLQWSRAGRPLTTIRHSQHSDGTLVISQLKSEDAGVYTCSASTNQQLQERHIQLRVQSDPRITTAPNNIQVTQGSTAQLPCVVTGDNVNIGWSRNGVPVRPDGRHVHMSADGTLILNSVQPSDEGSYTCNAYTGTFSVSATAEVRVIKSGLHNDRYGTSAVPTDCVDQPELANCKLIVYARLCSSQYYSSFCCASCARYNQGLDRGGVIA
ncbi:papilin isoform X2 [Engraulis encrasicolus]|uniref:papilin isoform X2 n=1 Tax=Engraulis encrasicolus TaxID=184585 RepID=UPI002FCF5712